MKNTSERLRTLLHQSVGKKCWYVSAGGSTIPQFILALGKPIKRTKPVPNRKHPKVYRDFEGEISFFIRCWWRLDHGNLIVVSSDEKERAIVKGLNNLNGNSLVSIKIIEPAWDLIVEFSDQWRLNIFAKQTDSAHPLMKNWHATISGQHIHAGPGAKLEIRL